MRTGLSIAVIAVMVGLFPGVARAQPGGPAPLHGAELARGWTALASGDARQAAITAAEVLVREPRNLAAISLYMEAEIRRSGVGAGVTAYDQWVGHRAHVPTLLRVLALAVLREAAESGSDRSARTRACHVLIDEGYSALVTDLARTKSGGDALDTEILGRLGLDGAVRDLGRTLAAPVEQASTIRSLGATRNPLAEEALLHALGSPLPVNRAAAADALAELGASSAIGPLKSLLADVQFVVRFAAARALFRLGDRTGLGLLVEMQQSEYPLVRAEALEATATTPDAAWLAGVRTLLEAPDAQVRLIAARLMAPHDPEAAHEAVARLLDDSNIAVREAASRLAAEATTTDLAELRRFLQHADSMVRVSAAARLLALTR